MTLNRPIVQTYVEIRYLKPERMLYAKILDEILKEIRDTLYDEIGIQDDITGRATYSISARGTLFKIYIEQYINTLDVFNANDVVQAIMERVLKLEHKTLILETVIEYENLNGTILVKCPRCNGSGSVAYGYNDVDCPDCNGWGETTSNDPELKIIPLAMKGM